MKRITLLPWISGSGEHLYDSTIQQSIVSFYMILQQLYIPSRISVYLEQRCK